MIAKQFFIKLYRRIQKLEDMLFDEASASRLEIAILNSKNRVLRQRLASSCFHDHDCKFGGGAFVRFGQDGCSCGLTALIKDETDA
jgi:hypothetical protein